MTARELRQKLFHVDEQVAEITLAEVALLMGEPIPDAGAARGKVKKALALDESSIHYRVEMDPGEAREFCRRALAYNDFTADDLVELIDSIGRIVPPMRFGNVGPGWPNPNNGKPHHKFLIGNEGSRVIYLTISPAYFASSCVKGAPTFDQLTGKLEALGEQAHADEFSAEDVGHTWTFRFWWD